MLRLMNSTSYFTENMGCSALPVNVCRGCEARDRLNGSMAHRVDALEAVVLAKDEIIRVMQDELDSANLRIARMRDSMYPPMPLKAVAVSEVTSHG